MPQLMRTAKWRSGTLLVELNNFSASPSDETDRTPMGDERDELLNGEKSPGGSRQGFGVENSASFLQLGAGRLPPLTGRLRWCLFQGMGLHWHRVRAPGTWR